MTARAHGHPMRLTVGEIAYAVAQLTSYNKALKLVSTQFPDGRTEDALLLIQVSGQSLHARELATQLVPTVQLVPSMISIGQVIGTAEWMLRCSRVPAGGALETMLFHLSPAGALAHEIISEHVQQLMPLASMAALLGRAAEMFQLSHTESELPRLRMPRDVFEAIWASRDAATIEANLSQIGSPGVPGLIRAGLADDLASPMWKGGISKSHYPQDRELDVTASLYLTGGRRIWLFHPESPVTISLSEATRQRFAEVAAAAIEQIPADQRVFK